MLVDLVTVESVEPDARLLHPRDRTGGGVAWVDFRRSRWPGQDCNTSVAVCCKIPDFPHIRSSAFSQVLHGVAWRCTHHLAEPIETIFADGAKRGISGHPLPSAASISTMSFIHFDASTNTWGVARFAAGRASASDEISKSARKSACKFSCGPSIFV